MTGSELAVWLKSGLVGLEGAKDEVTELDSIAGDGDLGITVESGAKAIRSALEHTSADVTPADVLRRSGFAFARANPSSFSGLVGGAAVAAADCVGEVEHLGVRLALSAGRAAAAFIAARGQSNVGDRTVLDALLPALDALEGTLLLSGSQQLEAVVEAASRGVELTRTMVPRRGRAAWVGNRCLGSPDAGAVAFLRLMEGLRTAFEPPRELPDSDLPGAGEGRSGATASPSGPNWPSG